MPALLVLCTCPTRESAHTLARLLVEARLAACVNLLPQVQSIYRWRDQIEIDEEVLLLIKTQVARLDALKQCVVENHPYELPEIIAVKIDSGLVGYLDWIEQQTRLASSDNSLANP